MLCYVNNNYYYSDYIIFGDWGLGIGDWAQSPIPNPQSPFIYCTLTLNKLKTKVKNKKIF